MKRLVVALVALCFVPVPASSAAVSPSSPVLAAEYYAFSPGYRCDPAFDPGCATDPAKQQLRAIELHVKAGSTLLFVNTDVVGADHGVKSADCFATGGGIKPCDFGETHVFRAEEVNPGFTSPVTGVESLPTGTYDFYCPIHPSLMFGTLHVDP
ncbi:MAG: hypothetical protein ABR552_08445 [Actinomycetota bacterium]